MSKSDSDNGEKAPAEMERAMSQVEEIKCETVELTEAQKMDEAREEESEKSKAAVFSRMDDPALLAEWLLREIGSEFEPFMTEFSNQKIDGRAFELLDRELLLKMLPDAKLGEILRIMGAREMFRRSARINRRNRVLLKGRALIEPAYMEGDWVLTNSALKVTYRFRVTNKKGKTTRVADKTFTDNIDLSYVEDVDLKSENAEETILVDGCCCFGASSMKETIHRSRVYLALKVGQTRVTTEAQTTEQMYDDRLNYLSLTFDNEQDGRNLMKALVDAIEEVQLEEGMRN